QLHIQYIRLHNGDVRPAGIPVLQVRRQIAVQLDGQEPGGSLHENVGERAATGTHLYDAPGLARAHELHDALTGSLIHEEVLPQPLARPREGRPPSTTRTWPTFRHGSQVRVTTSVRSSR